MAALCLTVNAGDPPLGKGRAADVRGLHQPSGAGRCGGGGHAEGDSRPGTASVHAGCRLPSPTAVPGESAGGETRGSVGFRSGTKIPTACHVLLNRASYPFPAASQGSSGFTCPTFPHVVELNGSTVDFAVSTCCWLQGVTAESRRNARTDAVGLLTTPPPPPPQ